MAFVDINTIKYYQILVYLLYNSHIMSIYRSGEPEQIKLQVPVTDVFRQVFASDPTIQYPVAIYTLINDARGNSSDASEMVMDYIHMCMRRGIEYLSNHQSAHLTLLAGYGEIIAKERIYSEMVYDPYDNSVPEGSNLAEVKFIVANREVDPTSNYTLNNDILNVYISDRFLIEAQRFPEAALSRIIDMLSVIRDHQNNQQTPYSASRARRDAHFLEFVDSLDADTLERSKYIQRRFDEGLHPDSPKALTKLYFNYDSELDLHYRLHLRSRLC
jgi:hypothetical protein